MKKEKLNIKHIIISTIISTFFAAAMSSLFTQIFPTIVTYVKEKRSKDTIIKKIELIKDTEKGFKFLKEVVNLDTNIEIIYGGWLDLDGDDQNNEYLIKYYNNMTRETCFNIISIKNNKPEIIFSEKSYHVDLVPVSINNMPKMLAIYIGGSGCFLVFDIYEYDGFTKMKKSFTGGYWFSGDYYFLKNNLFFKSNSSRYRLIYKNKKYKLVNYKERLKLDKAQSTHILRVDFKKKLKIMFDNESLKFLLKNEDRYISEEVIKVKIDESIIIDDNIIPEIDIKFFHYNGDGIEFQNNFFSSIKFNKKGNNILTIRSYDYWYDIPIIAE